MVQYHELEENLIEPNLRAAKGLASHCIIKNALKLVEFPKYSSCLSGISDSDKYVDSANHEQAFIHIRIGWSGHSSKYPSV